MEISKTKIWLTAKDYVFITLGIAIYAFGFCTFILPHKIVIGGLAGVGTIIYFVSDETIPVAVSQLACNLLLLAIAYKVVGKQFVLGTIYGAVMISVFVGIFQPLCANLVPELEPFMCVVIGGTLCGIGIGTAFIHNGSSGGTDIIAAMVSKHSNVTIGRTMLYVDVTIIASSMLIVSNTLANVVYGLVVLFMVSFVTDMVINGNRQAIQFIIFSKKWEDIATAINNDAHRGCTVLTGEGWYSKKEVKVLLVMCRKIEAVTISKIVKSIDPNAFLTQSHVNGVYGKGFDELKIKMKPNDKK
ncbi:MAG: YitT family protein [Muribaculaceae bacterium]|nr:YitT family protein [Muribaculaceae bacterium]